MTDRELVTTALTYLSVDTGGLLGYEVLAGGASGAATYRLRTVDGAMVLKVAPSGAPGYVRERAQREVLFYRQLAAGLGMAVPAMIAGHTDEHGSALLLRACEPSPGPTAWTVDRFVDLAARLGRFHATYWGREHELHAFDWLRRPTEPTIADIEMARAYWDRLRKERRFEILLPHDRVDWLNGLFRTLADRPEPSEPFPLTLCHGDVHIDNILLGSDGEPVLADWQEVGIGRGPEDLSFLIQRASFSGARVPVDAMVTTYRDSVSVHSGESVSADAVRRVADLAELRTRLLHWPAFLTGASPDQLADLLDRIATLADRLHFQPEG